MTVVPSRLELARDADVVLDWLRQEDPLDKYPGPFMRDRIRRIAEAALRRGTSQAPSRYAPELGRFADQGPPGEDSLVAHAAPVAAGQSFTGQCVSCDPPHRVRVTFSEREGK